jgi:hypothetical protein
MDRCPICEVSVKSENLLRHLNEIHPRHPDTPGLVEELKQQPGRAPKRPSAPFRVTRLHVTIVLVLVVVGVLGYYALPYFNPGAKPFPCVSGDGLEYHWHTNLQIEAGNPAAPVAIPASIGISPGCMQLLHTHTADGRIHIEPDTPDQNRVYTVGDFFLVWGKPFGSPLQMHVNGTPVTPSPNVPLNDEATIHILYSFFPS